jgi:hypothetical protein
MMSVKPLGELLIEGGFIDKELLKYALALKVKRLHVDKLGRILVNLNYIDEDILVEFLGKQRGAPGINLRKKEIDTIVFITGYTVEPVFAREEDLKWTIKYYYNKARILLKGRSN